MRTRFVALVAMAAGCVSAGCAVPQPRGNGRSMHLVEGRTRAGYWLYLPEDYVRSDGQKPDGGRWPLVMTFHGLRPYDDAYPQIREWEQEADRYGFIVCAPELRTCDTLVIVPPLNTADRPSVKRDETAILAIMDELFRRTQADPARVLSTSFSSGGYFAHYMVNRHPERFTCLAVRQSNFSSEMMDVRQVSKYRDMKVAIFFGENDFGICREESTEAVAWYRQHRFDVTAKYVEGLGHERTPQTAAAFFAQVIGVEPKSPPPLGTLVMYDLPGAAGGYSSSLASASSRGLAAADVKPSNPNPTPSRAGKNAIFPSGPGDDADATAGTQPPKAPLPVVSTAGGSSQRPYAVQYKPAPRAPAVTPARTVPLRSPTVAQHEQVRIRVSATIGVTPLWISYGVDMPEELRNGSSVLWTDNGHPISTAHSGYRWIREPGEHRLEALVITRDDREFRVSESVTVLPKLTSRPVAQADSPVAE